MLRKSLRFALIVIGAAPLLFGLTGCRSRAQNGALIGAGAGALGGYIIGNEMDK